MNDILFSKIIYKMADTQIKRLEKKAKIGWACYFQERQLHLQNIEELYAKIYFLKQQIDKTKTTAEEQVFPIFVQNEVRELYEMVGKELECPICLDKIPKDKLVFSSCGHKYCDDCLSKIDKCGVCRKKIYKKK